MGSPNIRPDSNIEYTNFSGPKDNYEKVGDFLLKGLSRSHKSQQVSLGIEMEAERVNTNEVSSKRFSGFLNVISKPMTLMGRACMGQSKTYQEKVKVTEQSSEIAGAVLGFHAEKAKSGAESVEESEDVELAEAKDTTLPNPNLQATSVRDRIKVVASGAMLMIGLQKPKAEEGVRESQKQYWDEIITKLDAADFSKKVQGSIDREEIASKINYKTTAGLLPAQKRILGQKMKWLQELVENKDGEGFDDEQLKQFLQFTTGASSFDGTKINLYKTLGTPSPLPQAVTCYHMLLLCPKTTPKEGDKLADNSKEEFKKSLLYAFPEVSFGKT